MRTFQDELKNQLNLRWAWEKVRREAQHGDIWLNEIELVEFEFKLEHNLNSIAKEFGKGTYRLAPLIPLPYPKQADKAGKSRLRQIFQVSVRDQVAWTAIVNVIGPHVDNNMPTWSYGNRLYRSIWVQQDDNGFKRRKIGNYRHASGQLYLPFRQSWPIFRRHVYLTTRAMMDNKKLPENDEKTQEELDLQQQLEEKYRCPFVMPEYWKNRRSSEEERELYWCSIDLEKFYPSLKLDIVRANIVGALPSEWQKDADALLQSMLRFQLNLSEWTDDDLKLIDIKPGKKTFPHIPTGLYVAGFLANAGLLKVDQQVQERLKSSNVAHFRFVDDHVILAYSFVELIDWLDKYVELLRNTNTGAKINPEKVEPDALAEYLVGKKRRKKPQRLDDARIKAESACRLDTQFPSPLMTKTLALVSAIARTDFNLLEPAELASLTDQLEHLLLVDLPEDEMPEKTRLSFAATRLSRLAECRLANDEEWVALSCQLEDKKAQLTVNEMESEKRKEVAEQIAQLEKKWNKQRERRIKESMRVFDLLRKVLRERPDRIRLWMRAVLMCCHTGVKGLKQILEDIKEIGKGERAAQLTSEYLQANLLVLVGDQAMRAARLLQNSDVPDWRKQAARSFLEDVRDTQLPVPDSEIAKTYLQVSWRQYCVSLYCAMLINMEPASPVFPGTLLNIGHNCLTAGDMEYGAVSWAWWASRTTLGDLTSRAADFVKRLGCELPESSDAQTFWESFQWMFLSQS